MEHSTVSSLTEENSEVDFSKYLKIRDFAYASKDPRHWGDYPVLNDANDDSSMVGPAYALYDFTAENESELNLKQGQPIYIQTKKWDGWLLVDDMMGQSGLVPENYVQLMQ